MTGSIVSLEYLFRHLSRNLEDIGVFTMNLEGGIEYLKVLGVQNDGTTTGGSNLHA